MAPQPNKPRIVMKFGGTSVGRCRAHPGGRPTGEARGRCRRTRWRSWSPPWPAPPTSSSTGCATSRRFHDAREYDAVVASGEQVTSGLHGAGVAGRRRPARSWLGWQIPIRHRRRPRQRPHRPHRHGRDRAALRSRARSPWSPASRASVPTIASPRSAAAAPTPSAVALAAALKADRCDIFTDVDGVYTTDPRIVAKARKLDKITYEEMLEMASLGAKVLQIRSVEMAMKHRVPAAGAVELRRPRRARWSCDEEEIVEQELVSGIAYSRDEAKITLSRCPTSPGVAAADLRPARRRQHQRRHDRAERVRGRRHHRPHLHRAPRPISSAP